MATPYGLRSAAPLPPKSNDRVAGGRLMTWDDD